MSSVSFLSIKNAVAKKLESLKGHQLYRVDIPKDLMWETYIGSYPEGTNPIFRQRTEHDCQCCKNYIRSIGGVVAIVNGKLVSTWDVKVDGHYQVVADAMSALIKSRPIANVFLHTENTVGVDKNFEQLEDGSAKSWNHFFTKLPSKFVIEGAKLGTKLGDTRSSRDLFLRALETIDLDSIETVLDLMEQRSLYKGDEFKPQVKSLRDSKIEFDKLATIQDRDIYLWESVATKSPVVLRIRNSAIGTLLVDLAEGLDLTEAVKKFEKFTAGENYKRPTAPVSKNMHVNAQKDVVELGLESAMHRRHAALRDISINNVLHANRDVKSLMKGGVFDKLISGAPEKVKSFDKVEEVTIEHFISNVLPTASAIEVLVENRHAPNFVSLIAPVDPESGNLFKWDNKFSWSYKGEYADSVKERVKQAGGKVDGDLRCSLAWYNYDDLDLSMKEPDNYNLHFGNRGHMSPSGGRLDVDMNAGYGQSRTPVENITYASRKTMKPNKPYVLTVHNFCKRDNNDVGFEVEVEFDGILHSFSHATAVPNGAKVVVAEIEYNPATGFKILKSLPSTELTKQVWGITTNTFHRASVILLSPNFWDGQEIGNKHFFFMLEGCVNEDQARGFYNEFLRSDLDKHRKSLEMVGANTKTEQTADQLSGLGFSVTQRNSLLVRVTGSFNRVVRVTF